MHTITVAGVNDAYREGLRLISELGVREESRAGPVLAVPGPVATIYSLPDERVLFDFQRDANPFFHLMESVWMLAGRDDATFLDTYVKDFSARFAEFDGTSHGAYGYRWRHHFGEDQLLRAARMLKDDWTTRRAIIAMWDPEADLGADKRDLPCNTQIYLRARQEGEDRVLDITVCNRSNDAIWGAYGANAVHMSILHEVLAGLAGLKLGCYTQLSNNLHAYEDVLSRYWPLEDDGETDVYESEVEPYPIIQGHLSFAPKEAYDILLDAEAFCANPQERVFRTAWFTVVIRPMEAAHRLWRTGLKQEAYEAMDDVAAADWQLAGRSWMLRRMT